MVNNPIHIVVLLREACDPRPPVRLTADGYAVRDRGLRRISNPADLCALEMALGLAESLGGAVTAVGIGPSRLDDHLRLALSMGAHRAIRIWNTGFQGGDAVSEGHIVKRAVEVLAPDLIFCGNRLLDRGDDPAPALAAAKLGIPCVTAALSIDRHDSEVEILRKSDRGARQKVVSSIPCAVLFEAGCCEPRYPDQDALMQAAAARIECWGIADLGLPLNELGAAGALLGRGPCSFPRPNPKRVVTPDAKLPAFERILALLSGGIKPREGKLHTLSAEETVNKLLKIFSDEGLLGEEA